MKKQKVVPIVLTVTGIAGMIATTVTAVKATPKALLLIEERKETANSEELPLKDIIEITWKCYAPSALIGITTIVCIASIHILD